VRGTRARRILARIRHCRAQVGVESDHPLGEGAEVLRGATWNDEFQGDRLFGTKDACPRYHLN